MKKDIESKIEYRETIAEAGRRGYEVIRLSRVKYRGNPYSFIDIRIFHADPGDDEEALYATKRGVQFREDLFKRLIAKWTFVPSLRLHKVIRRKAWPSLERSEFDDAVFKAFKAVEVEVRKACGYPSELVRTKLMRKAFNPERGELTHYSVPKAERQAIADLFCGAIRLYKNPHSHRDVDVEFNDAFEMLLLASHLLNIVDQRKGQMKP